MAIQTQSVSSNPWGYYHTSNTASPPTTSNVSVAPTDESPAAANSSISDMGAAWLSLNQYAQALQSGIAMFTDSLTPADGNPTLDLAGHAMQNLVSSYNTFMSGMQDSRIPVKDSWVTAMKQVWQADGHGANPFGLTQSENGMVNFSLENFQAFLAQNPVKLSAGLSLLGGMGDAVQAFTSSPLNQILVLSTNQCYSPQGIKTPIEEGKLFNIRI